MTCYKNQDFPSAPGPMPIPDPNPRPTDVGHPREGRGWD